MMEREKNLRAYRTLLILAAVNAGIYGIVYLRSGFYSVMQEAVGLTHTQMGNVWTVYGIVASLSYIFGGRLADAVSGKKLVLISAAGMILCGCALMLLPSYPMMLLIYGGMGVFAIFTYYVVSVKIVNSVGRVIGGGKAFGLYWTLINLCNAIATGINIRNSARLAGRDAEILRAALTIFLFMLTGAAVLFAVFYRDERPCGEKVAENQNNRKLSFSVLRNKTILMTGLVVFFNYLVVSSLSYYVPYMRNVLGFSQTQVLIVNLIKGEALGTIIMLTVGIITDKLGSAIRLFMYASAMGAAALLVLTIVAGTVPIPLVILVLMALITMLMNGSKSVAMVIPEEIHIPEDQMGTAVGIISFIGYLPDAFYYSAAGKVIDSLGNNGYTMLFAVDIAAALSCSVLCRELLKRSKNNDISTGYQ